ncbi:MAG TPA: chromosome segregation protein SMC [Longimicrobiales bacterium]|nr:chromosome segregation protein SMC [Longimicrobiales bacterium]
MKLRALRVHGFKSFADATKIDFHDGITAIVGPNGCGKSNISDAIRWVLGEQRPTAIRGAKMEEAIFQGTVTRRPVNRGSVSLLVSNEDGALPIPFEEVEIGRQVFRDGGSEYSINRSAVRLRDVVDLYRDTGLGANAYAMIENRMIDAILSDRADERRGLFEEAAGIGKYKDRRKAATRRLERAELDLQRLEDVIAEVQTKVRSLARQKGKAERYLEYRKRRLDVEVTVVRHQLDLLKERLTRVEKELEGDLQSGEGMVAELRTAEAEYEALRLREVDAEKARSEAALRLEAVREQLVRWERDLAVADERATYADRRLAQIQEERGEARGRAERLDRDAGELAADRDRIQEELDGLRQVAEERRAELQAVKDRLQQARARLEGVESRERDLARRGAQLEGDAESSDAQAAELERRLDRLVQDMDEASEALTDLQSQGDLFSGRLEDLAHAVDGARTAVEAATSSVAAARAELEAARTDELVAGDKASSLGARMAALEQLERDREGVEPVVKAALAIGDQGVLGTLTDFVRADTNLARAVESYLGPLARALVVEDAEAVTRLHDWFASQWKGGGGLMLLPLDRVPANAANAGGSLLASVEPTGKGTPWVRALLDGVALVEDGSLQAGSGERVSRSGGVVEGRGVIRLGNPVGSTGVLERKEQLRATLEGHAEAAEKAKHARLHRESAEAALRSSEEVLEQARAAFREAEDAHRRATSELQAQFDQKVRMDRHRDELARQVEGTRAARARALDRAREAREDREVLLAEEAGIQAERGAARESLEAVQEEWEAARAEEARLAVDLARLEGDVNRLTERLDGVVSARGQAHSRVAALDAEEEQLVAELDEARRIRTEGEAATERLFAQRTDAESEVRAKDEILQSVEANLAAAEKRVRDARTAEREASDHRHALELERQELGGRIERIRERLEGEWGRALETLLNEAEPVEGDPEVLQQELKEIVIALDRLGPVNMLAVEEHEEESKRLDFLTEQRDDLVRARNDLRNAIREINKTATDLFLTTFGAIRENFRATFVRLFEGGEADLWLQDPEDPLESPVEIHASPRGKKTQRIDLLSGGERALTALSLLFGIYLVKPSPFCVLDEVDAPLDENNIGRFIKLLQDFKSQTQFVVITHNPRTIEAADWIYGVTMEEPGVSTIVGVRLDEALQTAGIT